MPYPKSPRGSKRQRNSGLGTAIGGPDSFKDDYLIAYSDVKPEMKTNPALFSCYLSPTTLSEAGRNTAYQGGIRFNSAWEGAAQSYYKWGVKYLKFQLNNKLPDNSQGQLAVMIIRDPTIQVDLTNCRQIFESINNSSNGSLASLISPGKTGNIYVPKDNTMYLAPSADRQLSLIAAGRLFVFLYTPISNNLFEPITQFQNAISLYSLNCMGYIDFYEKCVRPLPVPASSVPPTQTPTTQSPDGQAPSTSGGGTGTPTPTPPQEKPMRSRTPMAASRSSVFSIPRADIPGAGFQSDIQISILYFTKNDKLHQKVQVTLGEGAPRTRDAYSFAVEPITFSAPALFTTRDAFPTAGSSARALQSRGFADWLKGCWNTIKAIPGRIHAGLVDLFGEETGDFIYDIGSDLLCAVGTASLALLRDTNLPPGLKPGPPGAAYCYSDSGWPIALSPDPTLEAGQSGARLQTFRGYVPYENSAGWIVPPWSQLYQRAIGRLTWLASQGSGSNHDLLQRLKGLVTYLETQGKYFIFIAPGIQPISSATAEIAFQNGAATLYEDEIDFDCWNYTDNQVGVYPSWQEPPGIEQSPYISELDHHPSVRELTSLNNSGIPFNSRPIPITLFYFWEVGAPAPYMAVPDSAGELVWAHVDIQQFISTLMSQNVPLNMLHSGFTAPDMGTGRFIGTFITGNTVVYQDIELVGVPGSGIPPFDTIQEFHDLVFASSTGGGGISLPYKSFCYLNVFDASTGLPSNPQNSNYWHFPGLRENTKPGALSTMAAIADTSPAYWTPVNPDTLTASNHLFVTKGYIWSPALL